MVLTLFILIYEQIISPDGLYQILYKTSVSTILSHVRHTTVRSLLPQKCPACFSICHLQTPHSVYSLPQSRRLYTGKGNPPCPAKTYETLFITTSIPLSPTSYCRICTRPTLNCTKWTFVSPVLTLFRLHCIIKSTCQMTSAF